MAGGRRRRAFAALALAAASTAAAAGCGGGWNSGSGSEAGAGAGAGAAAGTVEYAPAGAKPLVVGLLLSASGPYSSIAEDVNDGFHLYLTQHGERLGGRPATVASADEGTAARDATIGVQHLLRDGAQAIVGPISGTSFEAVAPITNSVHVPLVGVVARPDMSDIHYVWNVAFMSTDPGTAIAPYIYSHIKGPVYAIGGNYPGGWEQIRGFTDYFTALGGQLANASGRAEFTQSEDTTDFTSYLAAIKASGAKAVYCSFTGMEAVRFVQQYAMSPVRNVPLFAAGFVTDGSLLTLEGPAAANITSVLDYSPDVDTAENRAFVSAWSAGHGGQQPSVYALTGYDAAALLDEAAAKAGPNAGAEAINAAIAALGRIDSPRGAWQFATATHAPIQKWYLRRVQTDGTSLANVELQELATLPD
ncbi:substrate-binding domain-containing protein [Catenulispora yoronensis]|uniref:Substrate-binding domain-containing protein n=1 Tax=Catenulispora yoronensis TaxID=450799 RepID=A0ABP5GEQ8_9ACTN